MFKSHGHVYPQRVKENMWLFIFKNRGVLLGQRMWKSSGIIVASIMFYLSTFNDIGTGRESLNLTIYQTVPHLVELIYIYTQINLFTARLRTSPVTSTTFLDDPSKKWCPSWIPCSVSQNYTHLPMKQSNGDLTIPQINEIPMIISWTPERGGHP
jgi:hypothetical protein